MVKYLYTIAFIFLCGFCTTYDVKVFGVVCGGHALRRGRFYLFQFRKNNLCYTVLGFIVSAVQGVAVNLCSCRVLMPH